MGNFWSEDSTFAGRGEWETVLTKYVEKGVPTISFDRPWNTPYKAIVGGAKFIASGYIDFDAYVVDPDSAILDRNEETAENIRLEIFNTDLKMM